MNPPAPVTPSAPVAPSVTVQEVTGADLNRELPPVNERAVATVEPGAAAPVAPAAVPAAAPSTTPQPVDKFGTVFRPGFHRTNADGSPFKGAREQFMPKGGRKPGLTGEQTRLPLAAPSAASGSSVPDKFPDSTQPPPSPAAAVPAAPTVDYTAAAGDYMALAFFFGDLALGCEGELMPDDKDEETALRIAAADFMRSRGIKPLPTGSPFFARLGAYLWKRVRRPKIARKLAGWFPQLAGFLGVEAKPEPKKETAPSAPTPTAAASAAPAARSLFEISAPSR